MPLLCQLHDRSPSADRTVTGRSFGTGGDRRSPPRPGEAIGTPPSLNQCRSRIGSRPREGPPWPSPPHSPIPDPPPDACPALVGIAGCLLGPARWQACHRAWINAEAELPVRLPPRRRRPPWPWPLSSSLSLSPPGLPSRPKPYRASPPLSGPSPSFSLSLTSLSLR